MIKIWDDEAWEDYVYWQTQDKKTLKRINSLIKDIDRNGYEGIGKPESLICNLKGYRQRVIEEMWLFMLEFPQKIKKMIYRSK